VLHPRQWFDVCVAISPPGLYPWRTSLGCERSDDRPKLQSIRPRLPIFSDPQGSFTNRNPSGPTDMSKNAFFPRLGRKWLSLRDLPNPLASNPELVRPASPCQRNAGGRTVSRILRVSFVMIAGLPERRKNMRDQMRFSTSAIRVMLFLVVGVGLGAPSILAQVQQPIPATKAFDSPACSDVDLGGLDVDLSLGIVDIGIHHVPSPQRGNPEWKVITLDSSKPTNLQPPTILEGFVLPQPADQVSKDQSTSEVAEEDLWWNHFTHDFTFKVIPDAAYQPLLSSWVRSGQTITNPGWASDVFASFCKAEGGLYNGTDCLIASESCPLDSTGRICNHTDMEVEWDSASLMDEKEGFQRIWGAVPEFVWPAVGDRVWVSGRWIFDCGHPGSSDIPHVQFSTEIHPPRALVAFRLNHPALDSFPTPRVSAPNFPAPQSYLPVTGQPVDPATLPPGVLNSGPTNVPLTEADIFVSVNGGGANDLCSITANPCAGHTGQFIPVNDRNYVFDVYPPGTGYFFHLDNGSLPVGPPVPGASLQWRIVNHFSELPAHACGGVDNSVCVTVDPIICLLDSSIKPPDQTETGCPAVPAQPTRIRVILPFAGTNANFFAQSILLGWDDVPAPVNKTVGVRTFQVRLHNLTVKDNGAGCCNNADWRVFLNVGGQYRYISPYFDAKNDGTSVCNGADALTNNGNDDCYQFDGIPWTVSVQDGTPIHVAVGGFVARGLEDSSSNVVLCRNIPPTSGVNFPGGCDTPTDFDPADKPFLDLGFDNDDRIGTYEFDLVGPDYSPPAATTTAQFGCSVFSLTGCSLRYQVEFNVQEVPPATGPVSAPLVIGTPNFVGAGGTYISATTPVIPQTADPNVEGFQYRFHLQGAPLPTYATTPFPVHWTHADLAPGVHSVEVSVGGANAGDGPYDFQYSAESFGNLLESRHTSTVVLDTTPPVVSIVQPQTGTYTHSSVLTLGYSANDGNGSGVASLVPTMDNATTLPGGVGLQSGQPIKLLTELTLGSHTFSVSATDNVNNVGTSSVTFTVIVTSRSIMDDVRQFLHSGAIKHEEVAESLLEKLDEAAEARAKGRCSAASRIYQAFIHELQKRTGKDVAASAAAIMIADANYLIAHCP
jgi:hypothetical protein